MRLDPFVAALCLLAGMQNPPDAKQEAQKPPFPLSDTALNAKLPELIEGAWQLQRAESPQVDLAQGDTIGYALFHDGYLAIEIHGWGLNNAPDTTGLFFQTGMHRYSFGEDGVMTTYALIGTTNWTLDEEVEFMPPGERRRFQVAIQDNLMTLKRTDGTTLHFFKLGKLPFPGSTENVDAFGRPVTPTEPKPDKHPPPEKKPPEKKNE